MLRNYIASFVMLFMAVLLGVSPSLAQTANVTPPPVSSSVTNPSIDGAYKLGVGDKVDIVTFGEADMSGAFVVSSTGDIAFPLIGNISVEGKTVDQFQDELIMRLKAGYLKDPKVSISVSNYRPFYILGEVNKPGEYPYSNGLNVLNAVAKAGGFTYRAKTNKVYIRHANDNSETLLPLNADTVVAPGDTIRVAERYF